MSTSYIEQTRQRHEDIEGHMHAMVDELLIENKTQKDRIQQEAKISLRIKKITEAGHSLVELYKEEEEEEEEEEKEGKEKKKKKERKKQQHILSPRAEELKEITGEYVFEVFYERLKNTKKYFKNFPELTTQKPNYDIKVNTKSNFSGAELGGTFLDLHSHFETYVNMKNIFKTIDKNDDNKRTNYQNYLNSFSINLSHLKKEIKLKHYNYFKYLKYIDALSSYLFNFVAKTNPLIEIQTVKELILEEFESLWKQQQIKGWQTNEKEKEEGKDEGKEEEKKEELINNKLFCSICDKLFSNENTFNNHLKGKKHKKNANKKLKLDNKNNKEEEEEEEEEDNNNEKKKKKKQEEEEEEEKKKKKLAYIEYSIHVLSVLLKDTIKSTLDYIIKKQTRTYEEIAQDLEEQQLLKEEEEEEEDSEEEEEELIIHNPLNLPLGWDGKPIPFWLYKLHGLNIEYKCDICGGYTYRGPRAFERHFNEWRHTYGLRCLGIENNKSFVHITTFEDAIALNNKLSKEKKKKNWTPEEEEEFEDEEGNVFNKKTYDDLKRQGLI